MNLNPIRATNERFIRMYERYGTKLFREALIRQVEGYNPNIMVNAYIDFYQFVFVKSAAKEHKRIREQEAKTKDFEVSGFFLETWKSFIKDWVLQNQMKIIAGVDEYTLRLIREITADGIEKGLNPATIAKNLIELVGSKSRALAIARTEGTRAYNLGTKRSAEDWQMVSGDVLYKLWIHSSVKKDPRLSHIQAQNKPIPKNDLFNIGGIGMEMPGDPRGGADNVINCGCTTIYISERLAKKRFPDSFG